MDQKLAEEVSIAFLNAAKEMDAVLLKIQKTCSEYEFNRYREAFGQIMGTMYVDVLSPIYHQFPDIKPKEL